MIFVATRYEFLANIIIRQYNTVECMIFILDDLYDIIDG